MNTNASVRAGVSLPLGGESAQRLSRDSSPRARRVSSARAALLAGAVLLACCAAAGAATLPAGFAETSIANGLTSATAMAFAPDGRVFVTLQGGQLRVVKNGALLATPFLTVTVDATGERGLLGLAFDPDFAANRFVYVYYTATTPAIHNRVSRFRASASNPDVVEAGSETVILDLDNLSGASNHNGGAMHFGPDGKLYIAVGENANPANAQTLANLLGKMLRINPDGSLPSDNPFFTTATGQNRAIWALGLRNPYTFAFQPGTGRMFINDVGQNAFEEVNDGIAGSNYGWPNCEGQSCGSAPPANYRAPLFVYGHTGAAPTGCAITGGTFYNPVTQQFPSEYAGKYFFADFCSGFIRTLDPAAPATSAPFATGASSPVDLQVSDDGSLWYLERGNTGRLVRVRFTAGVVPPSVTQHPQSQTVAAGQSVTFTVAASGSTPLQYQWRRNNVDIPGANSASYTFTTTLADNGAQFRAVVTNAFGSAQSDPATLTVTTSTPSGAGVILISEYRLDGPNGATDEFVELYNNTDQFVTVATTDGSAGWALVRGRDVGGQTALESYHVIPAGTVIPARAHYLIVGSQYGLGSYGGTNAAAGDADAVAADLGGDGSPFRGLALFRTAAPANFTAAERFDAAGCPTLSHALLVEGTGAGPCANVGTVAQPSAHYSLARKLDGGTPQDTGNNAADFRLVAVESPLAAPSTGGTLPSALGAPGPENLSSPLPRSKVKASLLDLRAASSSAPNRARDTAPHACTGGVGPSNCAAGTLSVRRRFTNSTGVPLTRLRFRILHLTTLGALSTGEADLRALSSGDVTVAVTGGTAEVRGTTLEEPPAQALGGGFNSTLSAGTVSLATPLAAGASINVQFVLGVQQPGNFRFIINVEAALGSPPPTSGQAMSERKRAGGGKTRK